MLQKEFEEYCAWARAHLAHELAKARDLTPEQGQEAALKSFQSVAPGDRVDSPDQHVYVIESESGESAGVLWFGIRRDAREPCAYVWDIVVYEQFRGKGYGKKAMQLLEEKVAKLEIRRIGLNVFGWNTTAQNLYQRLGYEVIATSMYKVLEGR